MSINKHWPHVILVPEDDAIRNIANGFVQGIAGVDERWHVMDIQNGWPKVFEFVTGELPKLQSVEWRIVVALIDFDRVHLPRYKRFFDGLPKSVQERVFLFGCRNQAEYLMRESKRSGYELGQELIRGCLENDFSLWETHQLEVNASELERLRQFLASRDFQIGKPPNRL